MSTPASNFDDEDNQKPNGNPNYSVLGYVTPWNSRGYELSIKYGGTAITHVSPVWFDISLSSSSSAPILQGLHNINTTWIQALQAKSVKVVPRYKFEVTTQQDATKLFTPQTPFQTKIFELISETTKKHGFDGAVIEWGYLPLNDKNMKQAITTLLKGIRNGGAVQTLIAVVPAQSDLFNANTFEWMSSLVDGFSLMLYDHNRNPAGGPNAPLRWMQSTIQTLLKKKKVPNKIYAGLNFYGYDYGGKQGQQAFTWNDVSKLLEKSTANEMTIKWNEEHQEHVFEYSKKIKGKANHERKKHVLYFPTPMSVAKRVAMIVDEMKQSISIWELGQGMEAFLREIEKKRFQQ